MVIPSLGEQADKNRAEPTVHAAARSREMIFFMIKTPFCNVVI